MVRDRVYFVKAEWDDESGVWFVSQTDVPGLVAEAETPSELLSLLDTLIPEMLEANGLGDLPGIPYSVTLDHLKTGRTAA